MLRRTFAAGLVLAGAARPQNFKKQQRGRELIDQCIQALGGQAFLNMQDRLEIGRAYSFYRENLSGLAVAHLYTRYPQPPTPAPVSYYGIQERQTFGKKQEDAVLFVNDGAYEVTFRGVRPLPDETLGKHRESTVTNVLYILRQRMGEPGLSFESVGIDVVDNKQVEAVEIYDNADRKITVYLGMENKLPVMQRYLRLDSTFKERVEEIARFSKYKATASGAVWPMDTGRERDGEKIYQMFADTVTVGNNFDPKLFTLPSDMQMLKKENF